MEEKELCRVGSETVICVPGTQFTFGQGGTIWGPIPLEQVEEGMDVEGLVTAKPIDEQ